MKASLSYKIASILLLLFAIGHTWGFRQIDPRWQISSVIQSLQSTHFNANGFDRTYWDFFVGFGLFVSVLLIFASLVAWQFSRLSPETLASLRLAAWGFAVCFALVAYLSWRYFFAIPVVFSLAILLCLTWGAWQSGNLR
jgi:hypothetical protein